MCSRARALDELIKWFWGASNICFIVSNYGDSKEKCIEMLEAEKLDTENRVAMLSSYIDVINHLIKYASTYYGSAFKKDVD